MDSFENDFSSENKSFPGNFPSFENRQDSPPPRPSTAAERANFRELEDVSNVPIAGLMIHCLRYLGCYWESIFRVLESYDMGGTVFDVARYIEERKLGPYKAVTRPDGQLTNTLPGGAVFTRDFVEQMPVRFVVTADWIPDLSPRKMVGALTPDGRKFMMIVKRGQLQCCPWDEVDSSIYKGSEIL